MQIIDESSWAFPSTHLHIKVFKNCTNTQGPPPELLSNLTASVGIIEEVQETCDVEFLGSAMPLYAMFVGQLVSKLVPEKVKATSTEASTCVCSTFYRVAIILFIPQAGIGESHLQCINLRWFLEHACRACDYSHVCSVLSHAIQ